MKDSNLRNGGFRVHCLTAWLIRKVNNYYIIVLLKLSVKIQFVFTFIE